ncbi:MAG TPA: FIST N-terminal domain-containing protein [Elusimicrobiota bacterium]|nr:FIST N-terminal domain-containing protein [Elusimicrobiota bacterium]
MNIGIGVGYGPDAAKAARDAAREAKKGVKKPDLALAFCGVNLNQKKAHRALCRELDAKVLVGGSSYAEISPRGVSENSVAVLLMTLDGGKVSFAQAPVGDDPRKIGEELSRRLRRQLPGSAALGWLVPTSSNGYENEALKAVNVAGEKFPLFGGMPCGKYDLGMSHPEFRRQYNYMGPALAENGARLAFLELPKDEARLGFGFDHGWQPIGPEMRVTRCEGNKIFEIDGVPIIDFYRRLLGTSGSDEFFNLDIQRFGLAMLLENEHEGRSLIKLPVSTDFKEGSITCWPAEDLSGRRMRLIVSNRRSLVDGARDAAKRCLEALDGAPPRLVFMVSCCTRKAILHSRMDQEFCAVREVFGGKVPIFGFYTGGEILPFLSRYRDIVDPEISFSGSYYHTTTMGLLALGAKKPFKVRVGYPRGPKTSSAREISELKQLLAKSEGSLDGTEAFLENLARKSYQDSEKIRRQNEIIHSYTPHNVFARIGENVARGVDEIADAEFSGCFLFLDIQGFTAFSETREAAEVVRAINDLFDPATQTIYRHGGDVDKFIGDCIFAAFDSPRQGVACAQDLLRLFLERKSRGSPFSVRIGLNAGRAVRANVGSCARREYTYIGDAVNLTQRLEANCAPGKMLMSEAVYREAADLASGAARREILVKGRKEPVACYECGT